MRFIDLTGKTFGRLTVISRVVDKNSKATKWLCRCECGNECVVHAGSLRGGHTKSCGCLRVKACHDVATTHGLSKTSLHGVWLNMRRRCLDVRCKSYKSYGGRGIGICEEWLDFKTFYEWATTHGYSKGLTLERVDVNGDYKPENCTWITKKQQARNKTTSRIIEIDGVSKCLAEWCDEYGIKYLTAYKRICELGWEPKKALTTPPRKINRQIKVGEITNG